MKLVIRITFWLVTVITAVSVVFSYLQTEKEEERMYEDLAKRAGVLSESLSEVFLHHLQAREPERLQKLAERFSQRNHLVGISLHDTLGQTLASSSARVDAIATLSGEVQRFCREVIDAQASSSLRTRVNEIPYFLSSISFAWEEHPYALILYYDTGYIEKRIQTYWMTNLARVGIQALVVSLMTFVVVYFCITRAIGNATRWVRELRRGQTVSRRTPKSDEFLGPLVKEVSRLAVNLASARQSAGEEARLRHTSDSLWTAERLKEFVKARLSGRALYVISNREPYIHVRKGKDIECMVPASGLVTAIEPVLKACGGTWIAQGSGDADRETADAQGRLKVPPEEPQYTLKRVWLTPEEDKGFYYGFSNEGLWPLCHVAHQRPSFRLEDWSEYQKVNQKFADALLEEIQGVSEPLILIQDYHFALLPKMIKDVRSDARVAIFWHIPWPNPESFGICPWQKELLAGMLGGDIIGFHTQYHCNNFIQTVDRILESRIDYEHFTITRENQQTAIRAFPISIAFDEKAGLPNENEAMKKRIFEEHGLRGTWLGVGVDRLDYTKGILERLRAVECFLDQNPKYRGKFTFAELGAPSRSLIPEYRLLVEGIEKETERINTRWGNSKWKPILFLKKHHSRREVERFYRAADLCLVTSLHDGMNLVAKEFVASRQDEKGVLILSQFTGASRELKDSLIVNPYDIQETAEAIRRGIEMSDDEIMERMRTMRALLKERNIYRWASEVVNELALVRLTGTAAK